MEKTFKMYDAINCSPDCNFTMIPNEFLKNPNITSKAKTIMAILLSNKNGWKSYQTTILKYIKESKCALRSSLKELEKYGYLWRVQYRDKKTKQRKGSFWAYTIQPFEFDIKLHIKKLKEENLEILKNLHVENQHVGIEHIDNRPLIILNNNKTNTKKEKDPTSTPEQKNDNSSSSCEHDKPSNKNNKSSSSSKSSASPRSKTIPKKYLKFSKRFYKKLSKNGGKKKHTKEQIYKGANVVRQLVYIDKWDLKTEILPCLKWALQDEFWTRQIRSLTTLRHKSENKEKKFQNLFDQYSAEKTYSKKKKNGYAPKKGKKGDKNYRLANALIQKGDKTIIGAVLSKKEIEWLPEWKKKIYKELLKNKRTNKREKEIKFTKKKKTYKK